VAFAGIALVVSLLRSEGFNRYGYHFISPEGHFAPAPKTAEAEHTYRLRTLGVLNFPGSKGNSGDVLFALGEWQGNPAVYGLQDISGAHDYREPRDVNLLLVDGMTSESRWLFRGNHRNIVTWSVVTAASAPQEPAATGPVVIPAPGFDGSIAPNIPGVAALVVTVVDTDTNKDGELGDGDSRSLYVYRPGGGEAVKLLTADIVKVSSQVGTDRYVVVYEKGKSAMTAVYSVPEFKLLSERPLPNVPN
jgi:hypothetical protein